VQIVDALDRLVAEADEEVAVAEARAGGRAVLLDRRDLAGGGAEAGGVREPPNAGAAVCPGAAPTARASRARSRNART